MPRSITDIVSSVLGAIFKPDWEKPTRTSVRIGGVPGVKMSRTHKNRSGSKKDKKSKNKFKNMDGKKVGAPEIYIPKSKRRIVLLRGGLEDVFVEQYIETFGKDVDIDFSLLNEATNEAKSRFNVVNIKRLNQSIYFPLSLSEFFDDSYNSIIYEIDTHKEYLMRVLRIWGGFSNSFIHHSVTRPQNKKNGSPGFIFDDGVWVMPNCVIGEEAWIGQGTVMCHASRVYQDSLIEPFCWISPGARIYKHCVIGESCFIGAGSIITENTSVGNKSYISSGAYLSQDVPENSVVLEGINNIQENMSSRACFEKLRRRKNGRIITQSR